MSPKEQQPKWCPGCNSHGMDWDRAQALADICILWCSGRGMWAVLSSRARIYLSLHQGLRGLCVQMLRGCCAGTRCPLTALVDPCLCFVPQKSTPTRVKGFSPAETLPGATGRDTWCNLEKLTKPQSSYEQRLPFLHHLCTHVLSELFQVWHSSAVSESGALQELQWLVGLTSWKPAERPVCSPCHKCLWPISNVYVVQDHINSTN